MSVRRARKLTSDFTATSSDLTVATAWLVFYAILIVANNHAEILAEAARITALL